MNSNSHQKKGVSVKDNNTQQEIPQTENNSYYVVAESKILEDPRLTDELLVTFLHLSNFLRRDGFATCSDEWLAQKRRCKIRNVQYHLEALEKAGYLWRETWKEGMYWKRRIWLSSKYAQYLVENQLEDEEFKKCLRDAKNCAIDLQNFAPSKSKKLRHNKKSTEQKKKTTTEPPESSAAPPDSSLFSSNKPWIKKVRKEAPEEVEAFISYAKAHMHEAECLEKWLMACATKQYWKTAAPSPEEKKEKHEKIAKWIVKNYPSADIVIGYNYLEFLNGVNSEPVHLKFGDKSFEERCKKELKRRGLDLLFQP